MSKIILVSPNDNEVYSYNLNRSRRFPLGLGYIGAVLEHAGHDVSIIDGSLNNLTVDNIVKKLTEQEPQFVGIGSTTPIYHEAEAIIQGVKKLNPKIVTIIGGPHASALPIPTLHTSGADFVCIGEGEETVTKILDCVEQDSHPGSIPGVAYNWKGEINNTVGYRLRLSDPKETLPAIDLNKYPIPARHLFEYRRYGDIARGVIEPQTGAMFSRGCPGKCAFCGAANTLVRWRNLDNVLEELHLLQDMEITHLFVMDDTYTNNKNRVLELSKRIQAENVKLVISVQLRLDQIDEEICDALYASGVRYVGPGIESGNEEMMKAIGKGHKESKKHMLKKVRLLQKYNWIVRCSFVMGMLNETEEQILETIEFAKELGATENAFSILVPYPDSPLWAVAKKLGKVDDYMDFRKFLYYHTVGCNLSNVPTPRLLELHELAYTTVANSYQIKKKETPE